MSEELEHMRMACANAGIGWLVGGGEGRDTDSDPSWCANLLRHQYLQACMRESSTPYGIHGLPCPSIGRLMLQKWAQVTSCLCICVITSNGAFLTPDRLPRLARLQLCRLQRGHARTSRRHDQQLVDGAS